MSEIKKEIKKEQEFDSHALCAPIVFYRTYSRKDGTRESWIDMINRETSGLKELGGLTDEEYQLVYRNHKSRLSLPSGRWMWVGGTEWVKQQRNYLGAYNCSSLAVDEPYVFGHLMYMAMQGTGTGALLEKEFINKLPKVSNELEILVEERVGAKDPQERIEHTSVFEEKDDEQPKLYIQVGDSKEGWRDGYQALIDAAFDRPKGRDGKLIVVLDLGSVRPKGEKLKGFGGIANPIGLEQMFFRVAKTLSKAKGRKLTAEECCLVIDEAAKAVVAGSVRRSAGIKQFDFDEPLLKLNLWQPDENGIWRIDPERDALRMSNHSRNVHYKPDYETIKEAVEQQYNSGEGAIFYAPESVARCNADLLDTRELKDEFISKYVEDPKQAEGFLNSINLAEQGRDLGEEELRHRMRRFATNPCVTADTWVHTEHGPRKVEDLIGQQVGVYVNGELFSTTPDGFFYTGDKDVYELQTEEGFGLKLTSDHEVLKVTQRTRKGEYTEWVEAGDLEEGDEVKIHDHEGIQPWPGSGTQEEGWLLGHLVGDGSIVEHEESYSRTAELRFWDESSNELSELAVEYGGGATVVDSTQPYMSVSSAYLYKLAESYGITRTNKTITDEVEAASYEFYVGFLKGLFDTDGGVQGGQSKGTNIRLSQSDMDLLKRAQRMLARMGIFSRIYDDRRSSGYRTMPDGKGGYAQYYCKANHELAITKDDLLKFRDFIGFNHPRKAQELQDRLSRYTKGPLKSKFKVRFKSLTYSGVEPVYDCTVPQISRFDGNGAVIANCGEITGLDFMCNLSEVHANRLDPQNEDEQKEAFEAAALSVASLLHHNFEDERQRRSRELDPIIGASATGIFDFFVNLFGAEWLEWWMQDRSRKHPKADYFLQKEREILHKWWQYVYDTVVDYCRRHNLKIPNRVTCVKPSGSQSLLTGASAGWAPPKGAYVIRRVTVSAGDPVALAAIDCGYNVVPSQGDKDEDGNLLNDPFDPRVDNWLIEVPLKTSWAEVPNAEDYDPSKFSAMAQFDFMMVVQNNFVTHNCSSTIETRGNEVEPLAKQIYEAIKNDEGYVSATILARFDDFETFPRLPIEPISSDEYNRRAAQIEPEKFYERLRVYDTGEDFYEAGPSGCDSDQCSAF